MRKNVLILGHSYATQFIDVYNQYCRLFDPNDYNVTVAYLTGKPDENVRKRTLADDVLFLDTPKHKIAGLKIQPIVRLTKLCREKRFSAVICHRYKPSYILLWVALFCKIPTCVFVMHELHTMTSLRRQLLIAALSRKSMLFAGVSNAVRDDLRRSLWCIPNHRIITLYNVMDIDLTEPQLLNRELARKELTISPTDVVFGNVARLVPNKDHITLIDAFSLIKPHCPQAKLVIIGDGRLENELKNHVRLSGLENDVLFTGYLTGGYRYMKAFDCFVLSSTQEAFGRVLLEAMTAKIPIIATAANGIPEVVGNVGTLLQPKDKTGLAKAIQNIYALTQQQRDELGNIAYQHLQQHFSIPAFEQQFWNAVLIEE